MLSMSADGRVALRFQMNRSLDIWRVSYYHRQRGYDFTFVVLPVCRITGEVVYDYEFFFFN